MKFYLYNTLSRKKELFTPIKNKSVGFYTCGPTVYDYAHIGNFRTYIFEDVLRRTLEFNGYQVKQIMNITDVDDKTIKRSRLEKIPLKKLTDRYTKAFLDDIRKLNILPAYKYPRANEHVSEMMDMIAILLRKRIARPSKDGIYFNISKFPRYGHLAGLSKEELNSLKIDRATTVRQDEYTKDLINDFALWKYWDKNKDGNVHWGRKKVIDEGRPGWHIECSAMSRKYLGQPFDIHAGAVDLIFPHHQNEIAQSESAYSKPMARYWVHGEHLLANGKKMAKSEQNFYILKDIIEKKFDPLAFRYLCLESHYRSKMNFTWEALKAAQSTLRAIREMAYRNYPKINKKQIEAVLKAINDDLDMPKALAILHKENNYHLWLKFEPILALRLEKKGLKLTTVQKKLIREREVARKKGDFQKADAIRRELEKQGFKIEDTLRGPKMLRRLRYIGNKSGMISSSNQLDKMEVTDATNLSSAS